MSTSVRQPPARPAPAGGGQFIGNWRAWAFVLGAGSFVHVHFGGYLSLSELLLVCFGFLYLHINLGARIGRSMVVALWLGAIWIASALFTDIWVRNSMLNILRGFSRVSLLFASAYILYRFFRHRVALYWWFLAGLAFSSAVSIFYGQAGADDGGLELGGLVNASWEVNYAHVFYYLVLVASGLTWRRYPKLTSLFICLSGALSVSLGSRSLGGIMVVGGVLALVVRWRNAGRGRAGGGVWQAISILCACMVSCVLLAYGYGYAARKGWLDDKARLKYELQSTGNYGLLLSARPEFVGGLLAVSRSPIIGYGSWAMDRQGFILEASHIVGLERWGESGRSIRSIERIPSHSHLLEAWTEHGLLATGVWLFSLWLIVRVLLKGLPGAASLVPALCVQLMLLSWNIFFSPTGSRVAGGAILAILLLCMDDALGEAEVRRRVAPSPTPSPKGGRYVV